jgi:co-chaperonin GroES (HSP10)
MESPIKYKPKFGRVLIKREVKEKIGSIIISDPKRHATCEGVIVGLGETAGWTETFDQSGERIAVQTLKIGDQVIFGRHSGAWIDATYTQDKANDDGTLFICQDADILAIKETA